MIEWARQSGCRWGPGTCYSAARGGHLAALQWARHSGCTWDTRTCTYAAVEGHLAVLQWARSNNCPWRCATTVFAAFQDHLDILKWARQQQPPCPWWSLDDLYLEPWFPDLEKEFLSDAKDSTLLWLAQHGAFLQDEARTIACSCADRLTHAYIALRALLPAEIVDHILTLSLK